MKSFQLKAIIIIGVFITLPSFHFLKGSESAEEMISEREENEPQSKNRYLQTVQDYSSAATTYSKEKIAEVGNYFTNRLAQLKRWWNKPVIGVDKRITLAESAEKSTNVEPLVANVEALVTDRKFFDIMLTFEVKGYLLFMELLRQAMIGKRATLEVLQKLSEVVITRADYALNEINELTVEGLIDNLAQPYSLPGYISSSHHYLLTDLDSIFYGSDKSLKDLYEKLNRTFNAQQDDDKKTVLYEVIQVLNDFIRKVNKELKEKSPLKDITIHEYNFNPNSLQLNLVCGSRSATLKKIARGVANALGICAIPDAMLHSYGT